MRTLGHMTRTGVCVVYRCVVSDSAEYSAVATNQLGTATSKATVTVKRPAGGAESCQLGLVPHLSQTHPSKLEVTLLERFSVSFGVEGESISLVCSMVVVPDLPNLPPLVHWYRDDHLMKAGPLAEMWVGGGQVRLTLPHLAKDDEGLYTVRIFTKEGTTEHSAYLFVQGTHRLFTCLSTLLSTRWPGPRSTRSVKAFDVNKDFVLVSWKPPNTVTRLPSQDIFVDRRFHFRVRAVNSAGISRASRRSERVTAADPAESERLQGTVEGNCLTTAGTTPPWR
ncbi:hypothetical protein CRUP_001080 [Coryphaenoides rupestris]|nr:hypothetical protein CRUP_001080 [Coryphaenoides rupestris]